ncbi:hypothetical protein D3C76_1307520 [compost metagenome]
MQWINNSIAIGFTWTYRFHTKHRLVNLLILLNQLLRARHFGYDNVIAKQHGKGLIANKIPGTPNCMPQSQGFLLPYVVNINVGGFPDFFQQTQLAFLQQIVLQFKRTIEMILNCTLPFASYDNNIFNTGSYCFLHNVLNSRFVYDREHLFRHCLCSG